jgi:hypothetical protein
MISGNTVLYSSIINMLVEGYDRMTSVSERNNQGPDFDDMSSFFFFMQ